MNSDTILLAVHPEFTDLNTIDSAANLAAKTHAAVKVMHVVEDYPEDLSEWWNVRQPRKLHEQIVHDRQDFLDSIVARLKKGGVDRVETELRWGREYLEVTLEVLRNHHKLVVTTFRRQRLSARMGCPCITGLCRYAPCTVWTVRNRLKRPFQRLLVALGGKEGKIRYEGLNAKVLKTAAAIAEHGNSELHIVHVLPRNGGEALGGKPVNRDLVAYYGELSQEIEAGCNALLGDTGQSLTRNYIHLLTGSPTAAIPEFVQKKSIDLIVMGTHARTGLSGLVVGNTAEKIMGRVKCDVLVSKPEDFVSPLAQSDGATSWQWAAA